MFVTAKMIDSSLKRNRKLGFELQSLLQLMNSVITNNTMMCELYVECKL